MREELVPIDLLDVLLDPDNTDPIVLIDEDGNPLTFSQVFVTPYEVNDEKHLFAILAPLDEIEGVGEMEAIVFRVDVDKEGETTLHAEQDEKVARAVFAVYEASLREHGIDTEE